MRQAMQKLVAEDEQLCHQTPETFATVGESDLSWTEKLWGSLFARDGSMQIDCGLGKYHNRNVMECFAGISRQTEQMTARFSRPLDEDLIRTGVGAFDYEVIEPLKKVRFVLAKNDIQPLEFDVTLTAVLPPFLEAKDSQREPVGLRMCSDLLRYHQLCTVAGSVTIDGRRTNISDDEWYGYRDHSWGVRMDVGEPPTDVGRPDRLAQNFLLLWSPMYFRRPDGSHYEIHYYLQSVDEEVTYFSGFVNQPDGSQVPLLGVRPELKFDPDNRRFLGGSLTFDAGWGETRTIEVEPVSSTGFHLGTGLYFGFKGMRHGVSLGHHADGERYADVSLPQIAREVHQLRDCVVQVREGDATGYGILESIAIGEHANLGLSARNSFL